MITIETPPKRKRIPAIIENTNCWDVKKRVINNAEIRVPIACAKNGNR